MTNEKANLRREYESTPLNDEQCRKVADVRECFSRHAGYMESICPEGRYRSIVMTKLEEAAMFAVKSISHES